LTFDLLDPPLMLRHDFKFGHIDLLVLVSGIPADLEQLENLQRIYTKKNPEIINLDYWQRLKMLKMLSQERRMEHYRAIYVLKMIEGQVPNCSLEVTVSERSGREIMVPQIMDHRGNSL
jgi:hypothetical protein